MTDRKSIEMTVSLRNNLIKSRRLAKGWSQKELAIAAGLGMGTVQEMEQMRPKRAKTLIKILESLALALGCEPHELWDETMGEIQAHTITKLFDVEEVISLSSSRAERLAIPANSMYEDRDRRKAIDRVLDTLSHREERIIKLLYGFDGESMSRDEIAASEDIGRDRLRQIEAKVIKKLKHPTRKRHLQDYDPTPPPIKRKEPSMPRYRRDAEGHIIDEVER